MTLFHTYAQVIFSILISGANRFCYWDGNALGVIVAGKISQKEARSLMWLKLKAICQTWLDNCDGMMTDKIRSGMQRLSKRKNINYIGPVRK